MSAGTLGGVSELTNGNRHRRGGGSGLRRFEGHREGAGCSRCDAGTARVGLAIACACSRDCDRYSGQGYIQIVSQRNRACNLAASYQDKPEAETGWRHRRLKYSSTRQAHCLRTVGRIVCQGDGSAIASRRRGRERHAKANAGDTYGFLPAAGAIVWAAARDAQVGCRNGHSAQARLQVRRGFSADRPGLRRRPPRRSRGHRSPIRGVSV